MPEGFYAFHDSLTAMYDFLSAGPLPPPAFPPGTPGAPGAPPPGGVFQYIDFAAIAEFLPPSFLPPEVVAGAFENFGAGHPLIGDGGEVNAELEDALFDHPPVPEGFEGFDFAGDFPQFDDMFTKYDAANAGMAATGQVNSIHTGELEDGSFAKTSETTLVEAITGQATPLILMEEGVYQTQWVVDIHQTISSHVAVEHPDTPGAGVEFDTNREVFSQMTWTMLIKEVDTDGDGVADQIQTSGANQVVVLEETQDGEAPEGMPPLPPPPEMVLPLTFQGVMQGGAVDGGTAPAEPQ